MRAPPPSRSSSSSPTPSPHRRKNNGTPLKDKKKTSGPLFAVPSNLAGFQILFLILNVVLFVIAIKKPIVYLPWLLSIIASITAYIQIDKAATIQAQGILNTYKKEDIKKILRNDDNYFTDTHVHTKLKKLTSR